VSSLPQHLEDGTLGLKGQQWTRVEDGERI